MLTAFIALAVLASQQQADRSVEPAAASARMLSQEKFQLRWHGVGELRASANMCIASTTGRFQLDIQPMSLSARNADSPAFEMIVSTQAGDRVVRQFKSDEALFFEGRTSRDDCRGTGNVTIEIRFQHQELTETIAGEYLKRFQYHVRPA